MNTVNTDDAYLTEENLAHFKKTITTVKDNIVLTAADFIRDLKVYCTLKKDHTKGTVHFRTLLYKYDDSDKSPQTFEFKWLDLFLDGHVDLVTSNICECCGEVDPGLKMIFTLPKSAIPDGWMTIMGVREPVNKITISPDFKPLVKCVIEYENFHGDKQRKFSSPELRDAACNFAKLPIPSRDLSQVTITKLEGPSLLELSADEYANIYKVKQPVNSTNKTSEN
jgi:hypothetical protein